MDIALFWLDEPLINCWSFEPNLLIICRSNCGRQALFALAYFPEVCTKNCNYVPYSIGKFMLFEWITIGYTRWIEIEDLSLSE